jgi:hypothetical protein
VFKADGPETESRYAVSEWWLEPRTQGPGPHSHAEDDLFYVIEGTMSIFVGESWVELPKGRSSSYPEASYMISKTGEAARAGILNFSVPGSFEPEMPGIAEWFAKNPPKDTGT